MKLTTAKEIKNQKESGINNVLKLKKLIQSAANLKSQGTELIETSRVASNNHLQLTINSHLFPKSLKKTAFLLNKSNRVHSEASEDKQNCNGFSNKESGKCSKLKISALTKSVKQLPTSNINNINNFKAKKLQCLSKNAEKPPIIGKFTIDDFVLGKKLGRGRFGNVYLAEQKRTKFLLAIKIVNKKQLKDSQMQSQLISQIKLQSYTKHPNILSMYGFFHDETNIYLMIELAEECLFKILRRCDYFHENQSSYFVKQIIEGLKYLHSENIIHRDLKPENIMIVNNVAKIADFGWSVYSPLYKRSTFCGTLDYVSPEIVQGDFYDESVDNWSLGVLMYELNVGNAPFQGGCNEEQTFDKIVDGTFQIPRTLSAPLVSLIKMCLMKNPKERCSLRMIEESNWLKMYEKQGRNISKQIWNFWEDIK